MIVGHLECGRSPADLILMGIRMPVVDGYEATREIKRMAKTQA